MKCTKSLPLATLLLAACGGPQGLPKPMLEAPITNGPWTTLVNSCQVHGRTEDFTLSTNGHVEHNTLRFYLLFKSPQAGIPMLSISGLNIPFRAEGKSPAYGFNMAFTPAIAAQLSQPATHFTVRYANAGATQTFESSLPTNSFIESLNNLGPYCP